MREYKIKVRPNKSLTYALPLLEEELNLEFCQLISNSYIINNDDEKSFSILYRFLGKPEFTKFEGRLMKHELFKGHEDYGNYVLYKFDLTQEMEEGLSLFKEGKYSKFSNKHKNSILQFLEKRKWSTTKVGMILNRDDTLIQARKKKGEVIGDEDELLEKPDMKDENFSECLTKIEYEREYGN